jgi:Oxidoreductase family, NAD-binding Rossmann fold
MSSVVRWAIAGTGGIARRTVGDLQPCENAELVGVCSRDQAKADSFAAEYGLPRAFGDFTELCESEDVDAVYIGIPHGRHFEYASQALSAGKHERAALRAARPSTHHWTTTGATDRRRLLLRARGSRVRPHVSRRWRRDRARMAGTPHSPDRGHARRASHHRRPSRCLADATHRTVGLGELDTQDVCA